MNVDSVLKFIKVKRGYDYPVKYKLAHGIPLSEDDDLIIDSPFDLKNSEITSLPDNLRIEGYLNLFGSKLVSLPDNLYVRGSLDIEYTNISTIPKNLFVGLRFYIKETPLVEKYSVDDIMKMITDRGGYVGRIDTEY